MTLVTIILLALFVLASGMFSGSETALFSLSQTKIRQYRQSSNRTSQLIANLVAHPRDLLVTILMMNIAVNIMVQNLTSSLFDDFASWGLKVGVPLGLTLVFGEIIPKSVALPNNAAIARRMAGPINRVQLILGPLRQIVTSLTSFLSRTLFFFLRKEDEISLEELHHTLDKSHSHGILHDDEVELVRGFLDLQEASVKELMRPREEMIYYDINDPLEQLFDLMVDQEVSRVPVCDTEIDNMLGILSAQTLFLNRQAIHKQSKLAPFLSKPFFVPETSSARKLLRQMSLLNEGTAIIVDEHGAVSGLITREDLLETVVGEIEDLRDKESLYTRASKDVLIASSKLELADFEDEFGVVLPSQNNMVTLGGWLTEQLGDIPKSGTNYMSHGFLFKVLAADPNRIRRIYIRRIKKEASDG